MVDMPITTTSGKTFTHAEHQELARLIYKRFGENLSAATAAWRRLLQNDTTEGEFADLMGPL